MSLGSDIMGAAEYSKLNAKRFCQSALNKFMMPFQESEIDELLLDLRAIIETLAVTNVVTNEFNLIDSENAETQTGNLDVVVEFLREQFLWLNQDLEAPKDWVTDFVVVGKNLSRGFLESAWRVKMKGRKGGFNLFHVVIRRNDNWYELLLPR